MSDRPGNGASVVKPSFKLRWTSQAAAALGLTVVCIVSGSGVLVGIVLAACGAGATLGFVALWTARSELRFESGSLSYRGLYSRRRFGLGADVRVVQCTYSGTSYRLWLDQDGGVGLNELAWGTERLDAFCDQIGLATHVDHAPIATPVELDRRYPGVMPKWALHPTAYGAAAAGVAVAVLVVVIVLTR